MIDDVLITIDVDWAPDFIIKKVAEYLIKKECGATWFLTHDSPYVQKLLEYGGLFEFGIHPNFLPNSTQGYGYRNIMDNLMKIVPSVKIVRTHGLFQSSGLLKFMATEYGIKIDSSIYLRGVSYITPFTVYYDDLEFVRVPFFWTDDGEMYSPNCDFILKNKHMENHGLKVFVFHPIHIYLNSSNMNNYNLLKRQFDMKYITHDVIESFVSRDKKGVGKMFEELVEYIIKNQKYSSRINGVVERYGRETC